MSITATKFFSAEPNSLSFKVEDRFFTDLKTSNNTFKRTATDRFEQLDDHCLKYFEKLPVELREVLDIAVSSGSTTLALSDRLSRAGRTPRITGTDISLTAHLVQVAPNFRVLVDERGHPLQYELLGRAVRAWTRRADYFTGMVLFRTMLRLASRDRIRTSLERAEQLRTVRLLSPRLNDRHDITIERNDIFQRTPHFDGRFDFIRAANILNRGYFEDKALRRALGNIAHYLSGPGALLLVARSVGNQTAGTLFNLSQDGRRLQVVSRIGAGSEIEALVLATSVPSRQRDA